MSQGMYMRLPNLGRAWQTWRERTCWQHWSKSKSYSFQHGDLLPLLKEYVIMNGP